MDLPPDIYFRVVNISESYYVLRNRLKKIENSALFNTAHKEEGQPHGTQVSDPTARKAEKIIEKQEECQRKIKAIEWALNPLGPIYKDFIRLNLFDHRDMQSINLPMTVQEKKDVREFYLTKVARNLNEI